MAENESLISPGGKNMEAETIWSEENFEVAIKRDEWVKKNACREIWQLKFYPLGDPM